MYCIVLLISLIFTVSPANSIYYSSCAQSATRICRYGTNVTDRLQAMKKGGTDILSTNNYDSEFFLCEEYNYNCGYLEQESDFLTIANGVQLNLTYSELLACVPSASATTDKIRPYLSSQGSKAQCVNSVFPLTLSDAQSNTVMTGFLNRLASNLSVIYNANKLNISKSWVDLNINIKTAVIQMAKYNMNNHFLGSTFWGNFLANNWIDMSNELKVNNSQNKCPQCLHSAYLIDSVTVKCNKYQSINFLVDQSGSVGAVPFSFAKSFLNTYVTNTNDDLSIMSIHFYDTTFDPYIDYGTNRATMLSMIASKNYRAQGTKTGLAINATVQKIRAKNFKKGVPKIMVIMTDGHSTDDVLAASQYARSFGITLFCVGIGSNINMVQLLQIAGTSSNVILINDYASLNKLVQFIENYFCKQIIDLKLNDFIQGNVVRVPTSPSFFRVERSATINQIYKMTISYQNDPFLHNQEVRQSHFDPFPDKFSQFAKSEYYRTNILIKQYYIINQQIEQIPLKKTLTDRQLKDFAYVSVAGNALNFNISLKKCETMSCTKERSVALSIGNLNADSNQSTTNNIDPSIFIPIGISLGLLGLCTFGVIFGLRKFSQAPQQELQGLNQQKKADDIQPKADDQASSHSNKSAKIKEEIQKPVKPVEPVQQFY